jgi:prophage regulatory protein
MIPRLLRLPQVCAATGLRRTAIVEAVKDGRFPAPVTILEGGRARAWLEADIVAFILRRAEARDAVS